MIRVFLFSDETIPGFLISLLESSGEVQMEREQTSADVLVIYSPIWNRLALQRYSSRLDLSSKPVVIICEKSEEPFAAESLSRKKISGLMLSKATVLQMIAGLRAAQAGLQIFLSFTNGNQHVAETAQLTPRELEILALVADGEGNKSIADILEISEHTVKFHLSSIFDKLQVSNRTEAVKVGITRGLISI
jgi:two-component system, NarL family, response regulator YdfI